MTKTAKIGMVSLGCPKNQMDAELMLARLKEAGFSLTEDCGLADVVIVNTCGFIEAAKQESIDNILELAQLKKEGQIQRLVITGCMAERYQEELARELPECDAVLGLGANRDIVEAVRAVLDGRHVERFPDKGCWDMDGARVQTTPSFYAYLRIADGCDNCCTYCAIPHIRGRLRSRSMDAIVEEARTLAQNGVRELILVAQDTTVYGQDLTGELLLPTLLDRLCEIEGLRWIRLLYCYPERITDALLDTMARQEKIVRYLDIPVQHCSERVLKAMNREGNRDTLTALFAHIRKKLPGVVLRTTLMTGFPGETENDFDELCAFVQDVRFERLGCFAYSQEEGTAAASMPDQLEPEVKEHRRDILMEQQAMIVAEIQEQQVGRTLEVLVESFDRYAGCWFGRSAGDAPEIDGKVFFAFPDHKAHLDRVQPGQFVRVRITEVMDWDLMGERVD